MALQLYNLAAGAYVEDVCCIAGVRISQSVFWPLNQLCSLLEFPTSDSKDHRPVFTMKLLVAEIQLARTHIIALPSTRRADRLRDKYAVMLAANYLSPPPASKIRGDLGFSATLLMGGRSGGECVAPLFRVTTPGGSPR